MNGIRSIRLALSGLIVLALGGCQELDGTWAMACDAFAGDQLTLGNGRYSWDKFTDARRIDNQGRTIDPFPDYPKTGPYVVDGDAIVLMDDGAELARFMLHERNGVPELLTVAEHEEFSGGGSYPDCPLRRRDPE